jgi:hypothetical protein
MPTLTIEDRVERSDAERRQVEPAVARLKEFVATPST